MILSDDKTKHTNESAMHKEQSLIAQRTNRNFPRRLRNLETYEDMLYIIDRLFQPDKPRVGTLRSWVDAIQKVRSELDEYGEPKYPWPWMYENKDGENMLDLFRMDAHEQFALNRQEAQNLTQTSLGEISDPSEGRRQLRGLGQMPEYFSIGINPEGGMIIDGPKGSGKSEFIAQYVLRPAVVYIENVLIVHNMNIRDPRWVMKPKIEGDVGGPYCKMVVDRADENAMLLDNFYFATSYEDALLAIVDHAIKGIQETGHPYTTIWVVDEGGLSRPKQRTMSNKLKHQKDITLISRKLGCFEITIYQMDDAPSELKAFASHRYHKPSVADKTLVDSDINTEEFVESALFMGLKNWYGLRAVGEKYIEYGTYDFPTMNTDFDTTALFDFINQLGDFGMPVDTIDQLQRIRDFILRIQKRRLHSFSRDRFILYLYRLHNYCKKEYDALKDGRMSKSEKAESLRWRTIGAYPSMVMMARLEFPNERWYDVKIEREFTRIAEMFPDALQMTALPDPDEFPLDVETDVMSETA